MREYYCYFLILQVGMLGVFMALDFFLFYVFWEVMLVPMYFIIGVWGGPRRLYAAIKFFLYTLAGSVLLLLGILALYFYQHSVTGVWSFDVLAMQQLDLPFNLQWWIFLAMFFGFAIKVPMFPFHTWLPDAHVEAPTAGSVILAAILLKMGTYGFVRFSLPILPEASMALLPLAIRSVGDRDHLRCSSGHDAGGHEKTGRLFLCQPFGLLHAGGVCGQSGGPGGGHSSDAEPRDFHRRPLLDRGSALRAAPTHV